MRCIWCHSDQHCHQAQIAKLRWGHRCGHDNDPPTGNNPRERTPIFPSGEIAHFQQILQKVWIGMKPAKGTKDQPLPVESLSKLQVMALTSTWQRPIQNMRLELPKPSLKNWNYWNGCYIQFQNKILNPNNPNTDWDAFGGDKKVLIIDTSDGSSRHVQFSSLMDQLCAGL